MQQGRECYVLIDHDSCMRLQEDASEFLEESKLKDLVAKYSEFINFPIYLYSSKEVSNLPHRNAMPRF